MRIFTDITAIQDRYSAERGVPRYTLEYATEMEARHAGFVERWLVRGDEPIPPTALDLLPSGRLDVVTRRDVPPPDVLHHLSPFQRVGSGLRMRDIFPDRMRGPRTRLVSTLYDLIPLIFADQYLAEPRYAADYRLALDAVIASDLVLAISDSTARDAVRLLGLPPSRVAVIGTGVPDRFSRIATDETPEQLVLARFPEIREGFLLYVGGIDFRKNMAGAIRGFARLPSAVRGTRQLVLVCKLTEPGRAEIESLARECGVFDAVVLTDAVDDDVLRALYATTALVIFPSLYEGFGLPVVEALRAGAPVVVGDNSSLRDIVPIPEARFDASDPAEIARVIEWTLADEQRRLRTVREVDVEQHRWAVVVDAARDAMNALAPRRPTVALRPRIAIVTPVPPNPSGIAAYNQRLVGALAQSVDVDVFGGAAPASPPAGVAYHPASAYEVLREVRDYAGTVIAIGNSEHHVEGIEILRRFGGTVMLHDIRLTGLASILADSRPDLLDEDEREMVEDTCRGRLPRRFEPYVSFTHSEAIQTNGLLSAGVVRAADRVLVHSLSARTAARLQVDPSLWERVRTIPFGFPVRAPREVTRDAVTSFGFVSHTKRAEVLLGAFLEVAPRYPGVMFAFVGKVDQPALESRMREQIAAAGLEQRVLITGRVDDTTYDGWLDRSLLTIQPRTQFNGESSAAVAESIGAGVPTVVSRLGWMAELPADAVVAMDRDVTSSELARQIASLLEDDARRAAIARAGVAYARRTGFDSVAAALLAELGVGIGRPAGRK